MAKDYKKEERIKKANADWIQRTGPKRQKAKDNAWKNGSFLPPVNLRRLK